MSAAHFPPRFMARVIVRYGCVRYGTVDLPEGPPCFVEHTTEEDMPSCKNINVTYDCTGEFADYDYCGEESRMD